MKRLIQGSGPLLQRLRVFPSQAASVERDNVYFKGKGVGSRIPRLALLSALILWGTMSLTGCGGGEIDKVRLGYLSDVANKNVEEVLQVYPYLQFKQGSWQEHKDGTIPVVSFSAPLPTEQFLKWIIPGISDEYLVKLTKTLKSNGFEINLSLEFQVFKNSSFELSNIGLSYGGDMVTVPREQQQRLLQDVIAGNTPESWLLPPQAQVDATYYIFRQLLQDSEIKGMVGAAMLQSTKLPFVSRLVKDKAIRDAFMPIAINTVQDVVFDDKTRDITLTFSSVLTDITDYRMNELGRSIYDHYGIFGHATYEDGTDVLSRINDINYRVLGRKEASLGSELSIPALGQNISQHYQESHDAGIPLKDLMASQSLILGKREGDYARIVFDGTGLSFALFPDFDDSQAYRQFMDEQQIVMEYTCYSVPLLQAASKLKYIFEKPTDAQLFDDLVVIRNKLMEQAGVTMPPPLGVATSI